MPGTKVTADDGGPGGPLVRTIEDNFVLVCDGTAQLLQDAVVMTTAPDGTTTVTLTVIGVRRGR